VTGEGNFYTVNHNQTSLCFDVYEGPWLMTHRNRSLGSFTVDGIPAAEAGAEPVKVTFVLDRDGIPTASARVLSRGTTATLTVTKTGHLYSEDRVRRVLAEREAERAADSREHDEAGRKATIHNLATNFRIFLEEEGRKNSQFDLIIPLGRRPDLLRIVESKLPSALIAMTGDSPLDPS
jgi:molecular chaperone DnaK